MKQIRHRTGAVTEMERTTAKKNKYEIDMCNGTIMDKLISFSLPLMLSGILQLMFNAVDIIVVGRFSGSQALAAVGSTSALINVFTNLFIGISLGANVLTARFYAAGREKEVSETVHTAITLALVSGIVMALVGLVFSKGALALMGTPDDVIGLSALYMRIYFLGMPFFMLYNYGAAILRAVGDTKRPLLFLMIAGVINACLNMVLVIVFKLGVAGVAIATALIPPLCTAGFGLATGQIKFFVGAFYLFFINSVFIALATYLMVRFLKYEKNAFIDKVRERNVKRLMMVITLVTFIPSVIIGFHMVRVSLFEAVADKYVAQVFKFPHTRVIECNKHYAHGKDPSQIELLLVGEPIGDEIIENARAQMRNFGLEKAELVVRQANKTDEINVASLQQSYLELLEEKNRRIGEMTAQLKRYRVTNVEVDDISREVGVMMENIKAISLMKGITFDVAGTPLDTTLVCVVTPKAPADSIDRKTLASWLRIRTKVDNVKLFVEP